MGVVAYQGIEGSFSEAAARKLFPSGSQFRGTNRFREIFELVATREASLGVVPLENALAGSVHEVYDLFAEYPVSITAELYLPVHLCLLGCAGASIETIRFVHSHPKALEQCSRLFVEHPHFFPQIHQDTAAAARDVARNNDPSAGAIASRAAASIYKLEVLAEGIQNHPDNTTRFVAFTEINPAGNQSTAHKASFTLVLPHRPGSLVACLQSFSQRGFNLTKLESRPVSGMPYQYAFFIDCASERPTNFVELTEALRGLSESVRVLGVYEPGEISRSA